MSEKTERMKRRIQAAHDKELLLLDRLIQQQEEITDLKQHIEELERESQSRERPLT